MNERTRGQRWADAVTSFGGSWAFICAFVGSSAIWVLWNSLAAGRPDPYPFLFLNMMLTVVSTFQQPFVLLSQNRQNADEQIVDIVLNASLAFPLGQPPQTASTPP